MLLFTTSVVAKHKQFVVLTASYNNQDWFQKNLDSIFAQDYQGDWRLLYIDDCSPDKTGNAVEKYCKERGYEVHRHFVKDGLSEQIEFIVTTDAGKEVRVTLFKNSKRRKHLANQYDAIHSCNPKEIIVICDGDDWFAHNNVLSYLNNVYQSNNVWLTWGQFWYWKKDRLGCSRSVAKETLQAGTIREWRPWVTSHLRTYYAGLAQKIQYKDLLYKGQFFSMSADAAKMMPMIEMAGDRVQFIKDVLYIYNDDNQLSFHHNYKELQREIEAEIRNRARYKKLECEVPY